MTLTRNSITIVINGEWSSFYFKPKWIAENIYNSEEIEIGVSGEIPQYEVTFRCNGVILAPTSTHVAFTAMNNDEDVINNLVKAVGSFLQNAQTPIINAYGFNCDFNGDDEGVLASIFDEMSDNKAIIYNGYSIQSQSTSKTIIKDQKQINISSELSGTCAHIHFNDHKEGPLEPKSIQINKADVLTFIEECTDIMSSMGYDIEEDI